MTRRTLTLKSERLSELSNDELTAVAGGISKLACIVSEGNLTTCRISDQAISLCGCFTGYCSIDVC